MNKIFKITAFLWCALLLTSAAEAKLNLFPKARYIPELSFYDDAGKAYKLKDFKSDLLLVVLWSKKCGPCIHDLKQFNEFVPKVKDKGIRVIIISPDSEWTSVAEKKKFLQKLEITNLESYNDRKANFMKGMGIFVTPAVIIVNRNNEEVGQITGAANWGDSDVVRYMLKLKADVLKKLEEQEAADQQNQK